MPPRSIVLLILILMAPWLTPPPQPAFAQSSVAKTVLQGAELRGAATFRFLGLALYKARLYTIGGEPLDWNKDFVIELIYQRNLTQYDLVEATIRELKRTGGRIPVEEQLNRCFKAVSKGDSYLAVTRDANKVDFWRNGSRTCTLSYPQIKARFMGIFVGDNTRSSSFTRKLKGM